LTPSVLDLNAIVTEMQRMLQRITAKTSG